MRGNTYGRSGFFLGGGQKKMYAAKLTLIGQYGLICCSELRQRSKNKGQ